MAGILRGCWRIIARTAHACAIDLAHFGNAFVGMSGFILPYPLEQPDERAEAEDAPAPPATRTSPPTQARSPQIAGSRPGTRLPTSECPGAATPLPGHPERLVPHLPPSPNERWLWSQLD
jgi:hypothetical protein